MAEKNSALISYETANGVRSNGQWYGLRESMVGQSSGDEKPMDGIHYDSNLLFEIVWNTSVNDNRKDITFLEKVNSFLFFSSSLQFFAVVVVDIYWRDIHYIQ